MVGGTIQLGQKADRVWDLLLDLTGLNPVDLQREMNPILIKLRLDVNNLQMNDIRKIVECYLKNTLEKSMESGPSDGLEEQTSLYTQN